MARHDDAAGGDPLRPLGPPQEPVEPLLEPQTGQGPYRTLALREGAPREPEVTGAFSVRALNELGLYWAEFFRKVGI